MLRGALVKAVSFDVTGTLLCFKRTPGQVYTELLANHRVQGDYNVDHVNSAFGRKFRKYQRKWPCFTPPATTDSPFNDGARSPAQVWWCEVVSETLTECCSLGTGPTADLLADVADAAFERFKDLEDCWTVDPNVKRALSRLQGDGLPLAVISNFDERLISLLQDAELLEYFPRDLIFLSSETKVQKPDARAFRQAIDQLCLDDPNQLLHVGDSVTLDCEAAVAAGAQALHFVGSRNAEHNPAAGPHGFRTVAHLSHIPSIIRGTL